MILRAAGASGAAEFGKSFNGHCLCLQLGGCVLVQGQKTIRFIELLLHFSHGTWSRLLPPGPLASVGTFLKEPPQYANIFIFYLFY